MERRAGTVEEALKKKKRQKNHPTQEVSLSVIFRAALSDCVHLRYRWIRHFLTPPATLPVTVERARGKNGAESIFGGNGKSARLCLCEGTESHAGRQAPRVMALFTDRGYFVHQSTLERKGGGGREGRRLEVGGGDLLQAI